MTNRDAYYFVGKCLSMGHKPDNIPEIRDAIRSGSVAWEKVVWISTAHLVFPALFVQLKRSELISELPADLVAYMEEFTDANRERNHQIINQALEIVSILNNEGISPVFLKGTAHLLEGLYHDPAERMVGDIDLLVQENELEKAANILIGCGYEPLAGFSTEHAIINRHYPRLTNNERIAAVEIHHQLFPFPFHNLLSGHEIQKGSRKLDIIGNAFVPSDGHQILHNIYSAQINDSNNFKAKFQLSQLYNLLCLSEKCSPLEVFKASGKSFHLLNANLAVASKLLDSPPGLEYVKTCHAKVFLFRIQCKLNSPRWARASESVLYFPDLFMNYIRQLVHSLYDKKIRHSVYRRMINPKWYGEHLRRYYRKK